MDEPEVKSLTFELLLELHGASLSAYGGSGGIRDAAVLESALEQPFASFGGYDQYPTIIDKASILGFCLIKNHGFVDGNKRVGFMAVEVFLRLNGFRLVASADDVEGTCLSVADSTLTRDDFADWIQEHLVPIA